MKIYDHKKIESNWKDHWYNTNVYEAKDFDPKPKKYILAELPYPSGKSLHVGHMMRYTVPEIYSRYLRMSGFNVLFPMGWDCFGLPAETFAIKEKITPQEAIAQATKDYKKAMQDMGYGIDWDREINTSDPAYYKWTQWMFMKLWEEGLAIQQEMPVWWCRELGVLADEEVLPAKDGEGRISERGGYPVERKMFKQWVLNIPAYADNLIADLDQVDYQESVKVAQRNWIGRKLGALATFKVNETQVQVFTTRPDTIYGVTFIAISPGHKAIESLLSVINNKAEVEEYIKKAASLSDMEKQTKEKTGVKLEGVSAIHPLSGKEIPLFVADYILTDFGTGAVMGVPAHDERDFAFAQKYNLPVIKVIESNEDLYEGDGKIINSGEFNGMDSLDFKDLVVKKLQEKGLGQPAKTYKVRPQVFSRQRYWGEPIPLVYKQDGTIEAVDEASLPVELPIMKDFMAGEDGVSPLAKNKDWLQTKDKQGNTATRESDTMPTWAGSNWYYMRYIDPKNDKAPADIEKLKYWMPVDMYFGDAGHTTAHLLYSRFWYKFLYNIGVVPHSEPYKYRMSGGMLLGPDGNKMSKSKGNVINPQEALEEYGADAVRTYLAFIGPYEDTYPWNPRGLAACAKFINTIYKLSEKVVDKPADEKTTKNLHILIKKATEMMTELKMNTTVSSIMIFTNYLKEVSEISKDVWKQFILVTAPFMPFVAEELWQEVNGYTEFKKENSVHLQAWPKFDENLTVENITLLPVLINGKVRANLETQTEDTTESIREKVLQIEKIKTHLEGKEIKNLVYVPGKVINIVL